MLRVPPGTGSYSTAKWSANHSTPSVGREKPGGEGMEEREWERGGDDDGLAVKLAMHSC